MIDNDKRAIEEMARSMCSLSESLECRECSNNCQYMDFAKRLYKQDYRKQRRAEWATTTETEDGVIMRYTHRCTGCNYFYKTVCRRGDDYCHKCGAKIDRKEERNDRSSKDYRLPR